jgi:carbamoyltransferase
MQSWVFNFHNPYKQNNSTMTMIVLGVNFLSDASAALLVDGKIVAAASEERFNRHKLWYGYPACAIDFVLQHAGITIKDVDVIATTGESPGIPDEQAFLEKEEAIRAAHLPDEVREYQLEKLEERHQREIFVLGERTPQNISRLKKLGPRVVAVDHHVAHAASAYYNCGFENPLIITADGWGENSSHTLCKVEDGQIVQLRHSHTFDSLGYYYGSITKHLGFRPHRHEGKVLGLAAHGNPETTAPIMRKMIGLDASGQRFLGKIEEGVYVPSYENNNFSRVLTVGAQTDVAAGIFTREDISAGLQHVLEETVCSYITRLGLQNRNIVVAGGIFANVKLNQRIRELPGVKNVFIYPHMGDGGLSVGAAQLVYAREHTLSPQQVMSMNLGPEFSEKEILIELKNQRCHFERYDDIESEIAKILASGKVVARFHGRMEFGPRALGNRSILYSPIDRTVNEWLNKRLQRTEFMPFAPVTMQEYAHRCYIRYEKDHVAANFMTITYDCTDEMKQTQPAVVHIDGTARPQLITHEMNPSYYKILQKFHELTGLPSLINTSFNMHEEPIVCSPRDAIRAFRKGHLDYLAIGNFLLKDE